MKNLLLLFIASILLFSVDAQNNYKNNSLEIFLVRHAEKVDNSRDPELSEAGKQRANELAETLASAEIEYIHSTDFIRTRETAKPTAKQYGLEIELYNPADLAAFAQQLKSTGGRHLVLGHSNTTPQLVKLLGGKPGEPIVEKNEYDRLYVISISPANEVSSVLLRYGKKFSQSNSASWVE